MESFAIKLYGMAKDELGPLLRKLRQDAGISEAQMAVNQDVTVKTIQNWERGFSKPRRGDVLIYETTCGKTILDLRDDERSCVAHNWAVWPPRERRKQARPIVEILMRNGPAGLLHNVA